MPESMQEVNRCRWFAPDCGPCVLRVLRWTARISSVISLVVLSLFMFGGGEATPSGREWLMLALFPGAVSVGMLVAWRHEIVGGAMTTAAIAGTYAMFRFRGDGVFPGFWFLVFASPGIMLLIVGVLARRYACGVSTRCPNR